jgi:hypothetical protein
MADFESGLKKEVAEIKFLIHDMRVEKFINDVIHFHVTLNTDLEICDVEQVAQIHGEDLLELKTKAQAQRRALQIYSSAVKHFSPPETIISAGREYIGTIQDICELIINPLWGRFERVMSFLPQDSRSFKSVNHYRNCLRWICGVFYRIEHFREEGSQDGAPEEFDVGHDVEDFTLNVIRGYVTEKSSSRVDIYFDRLDSAVVNGNRHRFRRMLFNLVMNAVDAMSGQAVGELRIGVVRDGPERVLLSVTDNGSGMTGQKRDQLLTDRQTLDGELHSLGFVFVRQTVRDFGGSLAIESEPGQGTTMSISLPFLADRPSPPRRISRCKKFHLVYDEGQATAEAAPDTPGAKGSSARSGDDETAYGRCLLDDFHSSPALHRGCIFFISVREDGTVDFFSHRPYEKGVELGHEDLSPMFYEAAVRGRLEEDSRREPVLILKTPHNVREYFEFKELPEERFSAETFKRMIREEYICIAGVLGATGLPHEIPVHLTDLPRFLPELEAEFGSKPFPLSRLAGLAPSGE